MKSSIRNMLILLIAVGLLVGAYILISNTEKKGGSDKDTSSIKVVDISSDDIMQITVENQGQRFVFEREIVKEKDNEGKETEKKVWKIAEPEGLKVDESKINSIAINFSTIFADKIIEDDAKDLAIYGLDKPAVVTAKLKDGSYKTIEIGDMTPTRGAYYFKEKGSNKVYTMGSYTAEKLKVTKNQIRSTKLVEVEDNSVIELSMSRNSKHIFEATKAGEFDWQINYPIQGNANADALMPMIQAITQANVSEFVEEEPSDLSKYGLDKPSYEIGFKTADYSNSLLIGKPKRAGSDFYVKLQDSPEVFVISSSAFTFLDKPIEEIVEVFAYIVNIQDVSRLVVEIDGKTVDCGIQTDKDDKDKDKFTVNGKDVSGLKDEKDSQLFRKFYQAVIGVTLAKVQPEAQPEGPAEITFTYYLKKAPGQMKVEFKPKDDRYYYVVKNGVYSGILVNKKKFDEPEGVREALKKLEDAMNK